MFENQLTLKVSPCFSLYYWLIPKIIFRVIYDGLEQN